MINFTIHPVVLFTELSCSCKIDLEPGMVSGETNESITGKMTKIVTNCGKAHTFMQNLQKNILILK